MDSNMNARIGPVNPNLRLTLAAEAALDVLRWIAEQPTALGRSRVVADARQGLSEALAAAQQPAESDERAALRLQAEKLRGALADARSAFADARRAGRAEALALLLQADPETFFNDHWGEQRSPAPGGEVDNFWRQDALREFFDLAGDDPMLSLLERLEGAYWDSRMECDALRRRASPGVDTAANADLSATADHAPAILPAREALLSRLSQHWADLDPVDQLRGDIADAIAVLSQQPAECGNTLGDTPEQNAAYQPVGQVPTGQPARQPLTQGDVWKSDAIMGANGAHAGLPMDALMHVVRAVERAHGIGTAGTTGEGEQHV